MHNLSIRFLNALCKNLLCEMYEVEPFKLSQKIRKLAAQMFELCVIFFALPFIFRNGAVASHASLRRLKKNFG